MSGIVLCYRFGFCADIETGRTVRASQPGTPDLVRMYIAQCLPVQEVLEISGWISVI